MYATKMGISIPQSTDDLFPIIALKYHGAFAGTVFLIGLVAAAFSSADGSLTALTTSFTVDILGIKKKEIMPETKKVKLRMMVHLSIAVYLTLLVVVFRAISDQSVINKLFTIAGYTYGPLLGLYTFGLFTRLNVYDKWVPVIAILSPVLSYLLSINSEYLFDGYKFGFELLLVNGIFTFIGLLILSKKKPISVQ
ncbi:MAG: hypothetical protein CVU14_03850 [Bacteroidetes bacterium HGW-Bacteroidetes-9]|nr:MAG: hypothetical protein CVU14_03850 [Bacteroidetes bacterium HGW-Bacteroidetes-9]